MYHNWLWKFSTKKLKGTAAARKQINQAKICTALIRPKRTRALWLRGHKMKVSRLSSVQISCITIAWAVITRSHLSEVGFLFSYLVYSLVLYSHNDTLRAPSLGFYPKYSHFISYLCFSPLILAHTSYANANLQGQCLQTASSLCVHALPTRKNSCSCTAVKQKYKVSLTKVIAL